LPESVEIWSKKEERRRFSWTNLTLASVSEESSIACEKPFSPPVGGGSGAGRVGWGGVGGWGWVQNEV
jgi:hypothetical protein